MCERNIRQSSLFSFPDTFCEVSPSHVIAAFRHINSSETDEGIGTIKNYTLRTTFLDISEHLWKKDSGSLSYCYSYPCLMLECHTLFVTISDLYQSKIYQRGYSGFRWALTVCI